VNGWIPRVDVESLRFAEPLYLWLLILPAALFFLWLWRVVRRRNDLKRLRARRVLPVRERLGMLGDLAFWAAALVAIALCIVALARPQALVSSIRKASADIVVLQDASASMYVSDVRPDRWRRSVQFLRTFAETLSWEGDRVALALFAQLAAPQVRLTKDPNALFFFIDHLGDHSPFTLENATTWDTNIEEGIRWGLRLVEKDEEVFGRNGNPKAFLVISDGQSWSGSVATALQAAKSRQIPVHVVGILAGTDCRCWRRRILRDRRRARSHRRLPHHRSAAPALRRGDGRRKLRRALSALSAGGCGRARDRDRFSPQTHRARVARGGLAGRGGTPVQPSGLIRLRGRTLPLRP
jgi:hypothetical protein